MESFERLIPDHFTPKLELERMVLEQHVQRYRFAAETLGKDKPLHVLDLACGSGYGTRALKDLLHPDSRVVGVDIDEGAIEYARKRYQVEGVEYINGDGVAFKSPESFDAIVSFETIEHVPDPRQLLANFDSLLTADGTLIACVPIGLTTDMDRFHHHDFSERKFRRLLADAGFTIEQDLWQTFRLTLAMLAEVRRESTPEHLAMFKGALRATLQRPTYYLRHPHKFFLRLWTWLTNRYTRNLTVVARRAK